MHTQHEIPFSFIPGIEPFIRSCQLYCAELNLAEFDDQRFSQSIKMPDGSQLKDLLGIKNFDKYAKIFLKVYGLDLANWNDTHPFILLAHLANVVLPPSFSQPFDHHLWKLASEWGIDRDGLESFEDQMAIMEQIPIRSQARALKRLAQKPQALRKSMSKLLELYEKQNIQQLYHTSRKTLADMRRLMLDDRNERMADRYVAFAEHSTVFAAVGAAHLAGAAGMLRHLKQRGARLKPISLHPHLYHE